MQTYYEKHPVSPERKRELVGKGYRVVDARFAPPGWKDPEAAKPEPVASEERPRRRYRRKIEDA